MNANPTSSDRPEGTGASAPDPGLPETLWSRLRHALVGPPRDLHDPSLGHKMSLIAFLAWVGLGADGLSSSSYGPEEMYRSLGAHAYLALPLALATAGTVAVISYAYSRIIELFPQGGGGYLVSTRLLGRTAGVVSGSALLVDYVLTITVSIAGGGDAIFSLLPRSFHGWKLPVEFGAILGLTLLNLRGVKESVSALIPVFLAFIATHAILLGGGIILHAADLPAVAEGVSNGFRDGAATLGGFGLILVALRAYALGAGTFTGIEAVSNGLGIMRDPKVETGKRTMRYMATSLAVTAAGLLLCYLLAGVRPVEGKTLNTVLAESLAGGVRPWGLPVGFLFVWTTIASEAVLLLVAAQAGFIDGPRVMSSMAADSWLPRRFATLSDRLVMQNGILLMGAAAAALLAYTHGEIRLLVVLYAINVFLTFSLSELGMVRHFIGSREAPRRGRNLAVHGTGLTLCASILCVMVFEKLTEGGWVTALITGGLVALCFAIRRHYAAVAARVRDVDRTFAGLADLPASSRAAPVFDPEAPTAAILVGGHSRLGVHCLLNVFRLFPGAFRNVAFLSVGVVDPSFFQDERAVESIELRTRAALEEYEKVAGRMGLATRSFSKVGTDIVDEASDLCLEAAQALPRAVFFAGEIVFEESHWWHRVLHNETAYAIQRRIRLAGLPLTIIPILLRNEAG